MRINLDRLWLETLEPKADGRIIAYLEKEHAGYQKIRSEQEQLIEKYPLLHQVLDGDAPISLNQEEHKALKEYITNQYEMCDLEKEYNYYYGQSSAFSYEQVMKDLYKAVGGNNGFVKRKLIDLIVEARTNDAELEYMREDEEYQARRKESLRQQAIFKEMDLPKEIREQVDRMVSAINGHWIRYSEMIYRSALNDILAFLIEK